jgi:heterogeneous nuclear ribonucleoprotein L
MQPSATATSGTSGALAGQPPQPYQHHQGAVCMVYGLCPDKLNANRIFNLFCLYGNVVRVKFLKTKEGCAMVQESDKATKNI